MRAITGWPQTVTSLLLVAARCLGRPMARVAAARGDEMESCPAYIVGTGAQSEECHLPQVAMLAFIAAASAADMRYYHRRHRHIMQFSGTCCTRLGNIWLP